MKQGQEFLWFYSFSRLLSPQPPCSPLTAQAGFLPQVFAQSGFSGVDAQPSACFLARGSMQSLGLSSALLATRSAATMRVPGGPPVLFSSVTYCAPVAIPVSGTCCCVHRISLWMPVLRGSGCCSEVPVRNPAPTRVAS